MIAMNPRFLPGLVLFLTLCSGGSSFNGTTDIFALARYEATDPDISVRQASGSITP